MTAHHTPPHTLLLGIGNTLLADEGIGVHVAHRFAERHPELAATLEILDGGTLSFTLAEPISRATHWIVVDAAQLNATPGTLQLFRDDEMDRFVMHGKKSSVHEVGLVDLMAIAQLTDYLPAQRAMIAIQPQRLDWGDAPTAPVAAAIPAACDAIVTLLEEWHGVK